MIRVFYGNDRPRISAEIKRILGEDYEVFDGENLDVAGLVNIFQGNSLFAKKRKILIKDLTPARKYGTSVATSVVQNHEKTEVDATDFYEKIAEYVKTPHEIIIWETTVSQRKSYKDFIKLPGVEAKKFDTAKKYDAGKVFDVFNVALDDGPRAVKMLEEIKSENDPYMFCGLMASQAIKRYSWRQGRKERAILKELSKLDMQLKTTAVAPWSLIESFLVRLSSL